MVPGSLLLPINALQNSSHRYLLLAILTHYKQYCDGIYNHSGINCFWIVNNSTEVLDRLHQINKTSRSRRFDSYDFATLYTNIPHNALKNNVRSLVHEAFKIRGAKYIIVDWHGKGHWSLELASSTACVSVSKSKLVEWTEYLYILRWVIMCTVKPSAYLWEQIVCLSWQTCSYFITSINYLYMKNLMRDNLCMAKWCSDTVRYIDDLLT